MRVFENPGAVNRREPDLSIRVLKGSDQGIDNAGIYDFSQERFGRRPPDPTIRILHPWIEGGQQCCRKGPFLRLAAFWQSASFRTPPSCINVNVLT